MTTEHVELSIVMPCLNEAETLAICIRKAREGLAEAQVTGEIIVADNGSTDGSLEIAQREGARIVHVAQRGYGSALRAGIEAAYGHYALMADSDDSYDLRGVKPFVEKLREGNQLVMGTRLRGQILPGAMPFLHRWLGNPVLTLLGNLFFHTRISDYHCGMRAFDRTAIQSLQLQTPGMEFATEMVAKAAMHRLKIAEIPITYSPDGRSRTPHLRTWRDGWRHLSFMLLLSPTWVLLYPGLLLLLLGSIGTALTLPQPFAIGSISLDVHTLLASNVAIVVGTQLVIFWLTARFFATSMGILPHTRLTRALARGFPLSSGLLVGAIMILISVLPILESLRLWADVNFGPLNYAVTLRWLSPGLTLAALGVQVFFGSFVISLLNFSRK
jgi:hypothetical protein